MKKIVLLTTIFVSLLTSCANSDTNLLDVSKQNFEKKIVKTIDSISIQGEVSKSFIKFVIVNNSNKYSYLELDRAVVIRNEKKYTGLYDLTKANNNYYADQTLILKPHKSYTIYCALKKDLQFVENTSTQDFVKPAAWGISNNFDNYKISEITIPCFIGEFNENLRYFNIKF